MSSVNARHRNILLFMMGAFQRHPCSEKWCEFNVVYLLGLQFIVGRWIKCQCFTPLYPMKIEKSSKTLPAEVFSLSFGPPNNKKWYQPHLNVIQLFMFHIIIIISQCKMQTEDNCFLPLNKYVTTIIPLFSNPKNNSLPSEFYTAP